jgi:deoxycytidylate deaminase
MKKKIINVNVKKINVVTRYESDSVSEISDSSELSELSEDSELSELSEDSTLSLGDDFCFSTYV